AVTSTEPSTANAAPAQGTSAHGVIGQWWERTRQRIWEEARALVRIREVNNSEALLLAPSQAYFLRENLKLRLLNARLQLLSRNERGFRSDLTAASEWIERFFDTQARATEQFAQTLKSLQTATVSVELPNLSESLNAVRNFRPGGGVLAPPRAAATATPANSSSAPAR
ncbi:MAG TPA: uroporphyrinogen-III C-methyltransferase, partial [Burkholderiaceae bacterium]|nr:uroporphyrinogen-III C-methyltransferase [Burkholderiaceae bacterium]